MNNVYIVSYEGIKKYVLRISSLENKNEKDYLAETEFVRYLSINNAPVCNVISSINNRLVEKITVDGKDEYLCLFEYANGCKLADKNYEYRVGAPISEYFYNVGKTLGVIHKVSKEFKPMIKRYSFSQRYSCEYINQLIPDTYYELKMRVFERIEQLKLLGESKEEYGLIHFDFNDGNYHIDMDNGNITVFDFDNSMYFYYMFDIATLWINGTGWFAHLDKIKRKEGMKYYFDTVLSGYQSETLLLKEQIKQLPLFIDIVLIEGIIDEFESSKLENRPINMDEIEDEIDCLINNIPYMGYIDN